MIRRAEDIAATMATAVAMLIALAASLIQSLRRQNGSPPPDQARNGRS